MSAVLKLIIGSYEAQLSSYRLKPQPAVGRDWIWCAVWAGVIEKKKRKKERKKDSNVNASLP